MFFLHLEFNSLISTDLHCSVTKQRTEVIYQGTYGDPHNPDTKWEEYEFKCKPGRINRRPCVISPYHYRLDWLLWFAAFQVSTYAYKKKTSLIKKS